jgi:hypothetical protein
MSSTLTKIVNMVETLSREDLTKLQHFLELYSSMDGLQVTIENKHERKVIVTKKKKLKQNKKSPSVRPRVLRRDKIPRSPRLPGRGQRTSPVLGIPRPDETPIKDHLDYSLDELIYNTYSVNDLVSFEIHDWCESHGDSVCPNYIKKQIRKNVLDERSLCARTYDRM